MNVHILLSTSSHMVSCLVRFLGKPRCIMSVTLVDLTVTRCARLQSLGESDVISVESFRAESGEWAIRVSTTSLLHVCLPDVVPFFTPSRLGTGFGRERPAAARDPGRGSPNGSAAAARGYEATRRPCRAARGALH